MNYLPICDLSNHANPHISLIIQLTENLILYDNNLITEREQKVSIIKEQDKKKRLLKNFRIYVRKPPAPEIKHYQFQGKIAIFNNEDKKMNLETTVFLIILHILLIG